MQHAPIAGLVAAAHTPFGPDGSLDLAPVERQAVRLIEDGVAGVFVAGTTGESHSLTVSERRLLAERWIAVTRGTSLRTIVHVGSNCVEDSRALAAHAESLGADAVAALPPSYFKPANLDRLVECCARIAGGAPATPFYYYDIPSLTGVRFSMAEFLERGAAAVPTLVGLKHTNEDLMAYQMALRSAGGRFDLPWGVDECLLAALALGARGAVGSTYNFAAPIYVRLMEAFASGDLRAAREEQWRSVRMIKLLAGHGFLGAAKAVMGMIGVPVGPARLPNGNPTPEGLKELRRGLEGLGFFEWIGGAR